MAIEAPTTTELRAALTDYEAVYLASRNLAPRTRIEYVYDLTRLLDYLEKIGVRSPAQVARGHLELFLAHLDQQGFKGVTRRRNVASTKSFFSYLQDQGVVSPSPALKLIPPERERPQPRVLTEPEYKRLLEVVRYETRDRALIEVFLQTGIRLSEIAKLSVQDLELPQGRITNDSIGSVTILGKGRKTRTVTLNYKAVRALLGCLAERRDDTGYPHVFLSKFRRPMSGRAIEKVVAKYVKLSHIPHASPHTLRHTFATHHVKKGTKLDVVRQALGHSSLATTSIYVDLARDVMDKELQQNAL